jgi:hypothetical protein
MPNKFKDHIIVLPEDDANQEIANGFNGFLLNLNLNGNLMKILPPAGGWEKVVNDL